jgi:outer membrane protein OmpA-like peptidoglycan-associated protein
VGCVSARHYEEARSVAESETAAHGRTRARLESAVQRIHTLEAELARKEKSIADSESAAAQSKLDTTVAQKEREAAAMLVDQLRSELARAGDHLSSSSREKRDLQQALLLAEQRMLGIELAGKNLGELVAVTRDLALLLEPELEKAELALGAKDGQIVIETDADRLFAPNGDALVAGAAPVLAAVGKASSAHPTLRVIVREPPCAPLAAARAKSLGDALRERGVAASRLSLPSARSEQPAAAPVAEGEAAPTGDASDESRSSAAGNADAAPSSRAIEPKQDLAIPAKCPASLRYELAFAL